MLPMFFKEKPGILSEHSVWVAVGPGPYLYIHRRLVKLVWMLVREWKHERHLVG